MFSARDMIEPFMRPLVDAAATRAFEVFGEHLLAGAIVESVNVMFLARDAGLPIRIPGEDDTPPTEGGSAE